MAIDPDVKVLLDALEARVAAVEAAVVAPVHPIRVIEEYPDGSEKVYKLAT